MSPVMLKSREALPSVPWEGVQRKVLALTDNLMLIEVTLNKDARVPVHKHMNEQIGYVVKGRIKININGKSYVLRSGDSYCIPSNIAHEVFGLAKSILIDVFTPPVENFKKEIRKIV
jgi:quercetin dioxygenase-like cupin family protein